MTAARTSLPSSAIIIRRYTGKPAGRYRASPGRLRRKVICSSPRPPSLRRRLNRTTAGMSSSAAKRMFMVTTPIYSVFDLNVQVESTTGGTGITGKSKTKHPRVPRVPRGLLILNTYVSRRTPRPPIRYSLELFPQHRPVDFTVGVFRELFIEGNPFRWHHIIRQYFAQLFPQNVRRNLGARLRRIGAADRRALEPVAVDSHDRALFQSVDCVQGSLDLPQLDPIPSALDLRIGPTEEIEQAVGADLGQVASLINPIPGR